MKGEEGEDLRYWRVKLPEGVRSPFEVYVNGVRQELGVDYRVSEGELLFERELVQQRLGRWAWFWGFWGIGTYRRNDEVDVRYERDGQPTVAHALPITPPPDRRPGARCRADTVAGGSGAVGRRPRGR